MGGGERRSRNGYGVCVCGGGVKRTGWTKSTRASSEKKKERESHLENNGGNKNNISADESKKGGLKSSTPYAPQHTSIAWRSLRLQYTFQTERVCRSGILIHNWPIKGEGGQSAVHVADHMI